MRSLTSIPTFDSVLHEDEWGFPWTLSDDPAILMESDRNPMLREDGTEVRARMVQLRPGFIIEDVRETSDRMVVCSPTHYARSLGVALLHEQRRANSLLVAIGSKAGPPGAADPGPDVAPTVREHTPISTWLGVAAAVGIDDSTIRSHRRRTGDNTAPYFGSDQEARAWYAAMSKAPDFARSGRRRKESSRAVQKEGVVDWSKIQI